MLRSRTMVCGVYMWDCGVYMSCNVCMYVCICMCWGQIEWGLLVLLPKPSPRHRPGQHIVCGLCSCPGVLLQSRGLARLLLLVSHSFNPSEIDEVFIPVAVV